MHRILQSFFDRLTERVLAISGSMVASAVETQHAVQQAEHASALEDLARKLEADGKEQIAASLRNRIVHSETDDSGALADRLIESVVVDSAVQRLEQSPAAYALPGPAKKKSRSRRKPAVDEQPDSPFSPGESDASDES